MKVVNQGDFCTLLLDQNWLPKMTISARAVFHHMLKGHGYGLDANKMPYRFADMRSKTLAVYPEDQPIMRSAPNPHSGEPSVWIIPTVFVASSRFWFPPKKKWSEDNLPSLSEVHRHYHGICQRCLRPVSMKQASRDHWWPRRNDKEGMDPHAHGAHTSGDGIANITLMCRRCNADLGHTFPKYNVEGELIVPKLKVNTNAFSLPYGTKMWPGWIDVAPWLKHEVELDPV